MADGTTCVKSTQSTALHDLHSLIDLFGTRESAPKTESQTPALHNLHSLIDLHTQSGAPNNSREANLIDLRSQSSAQSTRESAVPNNTQEQTNSMPTANARAQRRIEIRRKNSTEVPSAPGSNYDVSESARMFGGPPPEALLENSNEDLLGGSGFRGGAGMDPSGRSAGGASAGVRRGSKGSLNNSGASLNNSGANISLGGSWRSSGGTQGTGGTGGGTGGGGNGNNRMGNDHSSRSGQSRQSGRSNSKKLGASGRSAASGEVLLEAGQDTAQHGNDAPWAKADSGGHGNDAPWAVTNQTSNLATDGSNRLSANDGSNRTGINSSGRTEAVSNSNRAGPFNSVPDTDDSTEFEEGGPLTPQDIEEWHEASTAGGGSSLENNSLNSFQGSLRSLNSAGEQAGISRHFDNKDPNVADDSPGTGESRDSFDVTPVTRPKTNSKSNLVAAGMAASTGSDRNLVSSVFTTTTNSSDDTRLMDNKSNTKRPYYNLSRAEERKQFMDIMNGNSGGDPNDPNAVLSRSGRSGVSGANLSVRSKDASKNPFENDDDGAASPLFEVANGDELNMPPTYKPRSNGNPTRESYSLESNVGSGGEGSHAREDDTQYASMQELLDDENSRKLDPFDRRRNKRGCGACCGTCVDRTFGAKKTRRRKFTLLMLACFLILGAIVGVVVYFLVGRKVDDEPSSAEMKNVPPSPNTAPTREENKPTPLPPTDDGGDKLDLTLKLPTTSPAPSSPRAPTIPPAEEAPPRLADRCPDIEPTNEDTKYVQIPYEYLVVVEGDKDVDDFVVTMENVLHQRLVAAKCGGAASGKRELRGWQQGAMRGLKLGEESRGLQRASYRGFNSNPPDSVSSEGCPDETFAALTDGQKCYRVSGGITAVVLAGESSEMTIRSDVGGYAEEVMSDPTLREPLGIVQVTVVDSIPDGQGVDGGDIDVGGGDGNVTSQGSGSPSTSPVVAPTDPSLTSPTVASAPEPSMGPNMIVGVPTGIASTMSPSYDPPTSPTISPNSVSVGIDSPTAPLNYTIVISQGTSPTASPVGGDISSTADAIGAIVAPTFSPVVPSLDLNDTVSNETTISSGTSNETSTDGNITSPTTANETSVVQIKLLANPSLGETLGWDDGTLVLEPYHPEPADATTCSEKCPRGSETEFGGCVSDLELICGGSFPMDLSQGEVLELRFEAGEDKAFSTQGVGEEVGLEMEFSAVMNPCPEGEWEKQDFAGEDLTIELSGRDGAPQQYVFYAEESFAYFERRSFGCEVFAKVLIISDASGVLDAEFESLAVRLGYDPLKVTQGGGNYRWGTDGYSWIKSYGTALELLGLPDVSSPANGTLDNLPVTDYSPTCPDLKDADKWKGPIYLNDDSLTFNYAIVLDPTSTTKGLLCGRLETPSESYLAFGISPTGTMEGAEAIVGLPDEGTVRKYYLNKDTRSVEEMEEERQTLVFANITRVMIEEDVGVDVDEGGSSFVDGMSQVIGSLGFGNRQDIGVVTIVTFGKYLEEDGEHKILVDAGVNNTFLWAVGSTNNLGYHAARGSFEVGFDEGLSDSNEAIVVDSNGTLSLDTGVNSTVDANAADDTVDIIVNSTAGENGTINKSIPTSSPTISTSPTTTASPSGKLATIDWPSIIIDVVSNNATSDGSDGLAATNGTEDNSGNVTDWNSTVSIPPPASDDNATTVSSTATLDALSAPYAMSLSVQGEAQLGRYGSAVAVSGDGSIVAVCAKDASNDVLLLPNTGAVHLYSFDGATLTPLQVIYGTSSNAEFGNAVALSLDGSRMVVGSRSENSQTGALRIYERDGAGSAWSLMVGGVIAGQNPSERLGWAVSISHDGNVVAGGSPRGGSQGGGTLVTYNYNDGSDGVSAVGWAQHGSVVESSEAREAVGYSVSLSDTGSAMVVGSPQASSGSDDDEVLGVGKVAMYVMTGTEWQPSGLEWYGESDGSADGTSVAMSQDGTVVVIGGKGRNVVNATSGEVITSSVGYCRIYKFQGSQWEMEHSIVGQAVDERLGSSVAVSSDGIVAACGGVDGSNDDLVSGVVRLWDRSTLRESTIWPRGEGSNVGGSAFGTALALSGNGGYVVVGAPSWSDTDAGASAGAIQIFRSGA